MMTATVASPEDLLTAGGIADLIEAELGVPVQSPSITSLIRRKLLPVGMARRIGMNWVFARQDVPEIVAIFKRHDRRFKRQVAASESACQ